MRTPIYPSVEEFIKTKRQLKLQTIQDSVIENQTGASNQQQHPLNRGKLLYNFI